MEGWEGLTARARRPVARARAAVERLNSWSPGAQSGDLEVTMRNILRTESVNAAGPRYFIGFVLVLALMRAEPVYADRVALVIGNAAYVEASALLTNPVRDARAMALTLDDLDFEVSVAEDADVEEMEEAVLEFIGRVRPGDTAVFYYSGHGIELDGENYLLPVDFSSSYTPVRARSRSTSATEVLALMEEAGAEVRLVILDACRDNPFQATKTFSRGGLAAMAPRGGLVAFAAEAGGRASDNPGGTNGLYTQHLLAALEQPGVPANVMFSQVQRAVREASAGQQVPTYYDAGAGDFVFRADPVGGDLAFGTPAAGMLTRAGEDQWTFRGRAGTAVTVELTSEEFDTYVELFGPSGELAAEDDDGGGGTDSTIRDHALDASGDYTVVARGYDDAEEGRYSLLLSRGVVGGRVLTLGTPESAWLTPSGSDRWTFRGATGHQVTVELTSEEFDTYVELFGPSGELVAEDDDGGWSTDSIIKDQALYASGDYTVVARSYSDSQGGPYTLSVRRGSIDPPSRDVAQLDVAQLRQIAGQGDAPAQTELGERYKDGRDGVQQDDGEAVTWFRRAVEQGHAGGQSNLGFMYATGRGVAQDDGEAVTWFRRAAEQGRAGGQSNLGFMYSTGRGVAQDDGEAVTWYRRAAEQGNLGGQNNLGTMYRDGRGVAQDDGEAFTWFRRAAEQGNADGQSNLGTMYRDGRGVAQDDGEAVTWFRRAAEQGNAGGQNSLGFMYSTGRGVAQDYGEAVRWYRRAAEQGNLGGQNNLGNSYRDGRGVAQDYGEAVRWYRRAAEQGFANAQSALGFMYSTGRGVAQDYGEAGSWYRRAAEQGHASGQYSLGVMYEYGRGVAQDYGEAGSWYRRAAEQGHASGQYNLGLMYANGRGVAQDYGEASSWYRRAAEQGDDYAQNNLGNMYLNGRGVRQDRQEAARWFRLAADQGNARAQRSLDRLR